jgi:hypothetical protein
MCQLLPRRVYYLDSNLPFVGFYENYPFAHNTRLQPRRLQAVCERLRAEGINILVEVSYPETREGAGYTTAIIFDAPEVEQQNRVWEVFLEDSESMLRIPREEFQETPKSPVGA